MVLEADPAGMGTLPMGCLDMPGYTMSDPKDFYQHMILEVVPNKINDHSFLPRDLKPLKNAHGRTYAPRVFNPFARDAINLYPRTNVLYSTEKYARGRMTRGVEIFIGTDDVDYELAWNNMNYGKVAPYFIAVPLPKGNEAPYVWIDLIWPIRSILLPVAQNKLANVAPHCVYVQFNFTRLRGVFFTGGWAEEPNSTRLPREMSCDPRYGLEYHDSPASMRIDIEKLYGTLLVPRENRKIDNELECLQLHRWDNISIDEGTQWINPGINIRKFGLAFHEFESRRTGVSLLTRMVEVKTSLTEIVKAAVDVGLGFVPIVGPMLAYSSGVVIDLIDDVDKLKVMYEGLVAGNPDIYKALVETTINFGVHYIKKRKTGSFTLPTRGYGSGSLFGLTIGPGPVDLPGQAQLQEEQEVVNLFADCTPLPTLYGDEVGECAKHPEWYALVKVPFDVVLKGVEGDSEEPTTAKPTTAGSGETNDVDIAPAPPAA